MTDIKFLKNQKYVYVQHGCSNPHNIPSVRVPIDCALRLLAQGVINTCDHGHGVRSWYQTGLSHDAFKRLAKLS